MSDVIDSLVVLLKLDSSGFSSGTKKLQADLGRTTDATKKATKEISARGNEAAQFFSKIRREALGLAAIFVGGMGLKDFVQYTTASEAATGRLANNLGMTTEALSAWQGAAERAGGTAAATGSSFQGLVQQFQQFAITGQASPAVAYFRALGIQVSDASGKMRSISDIMLDLADRFHSMSPAKASAFGAAIGLDQGTINLLEQGRAAVEKLLDQQRKLGIITQRDADAGIALQNSFLDIQQAAFSLGRTILTDLTPTITGVLGSMDQWLQKNGDWLRQNIDEKIKQFADYLKSIDWTQVEDGITSFAAGVKTIVDALGGVQRATEIFFALWIGAKFIAVTANLLRLLRMLALIPGSGVTAALLTKLGILALPLALSGDTADTPENKAAQDEQSFNEYQTSHPGATREQYDAEVAQLRQNQPQGLSGLWTRNAPEWLGGIPPSPQGDTSTMMAREKTAHDFFKSEGYSEVAISGILANLKAESGFNPNATNASGHQGIAQWSPERSAKFRAIFGHDPAQGTFQEQLQFIQWEMNGSHAMTALRLRSAKSASDAADIVMKGYEAPSAAEQAQSGPLREGYAQDFQHRFAAMPPAAPQKMSSTSSSTDNSTQVNTGPITIHTQATDSDGIAKSLNDRLKRYNYVYQANYGLA